MLNSEMPKIFNESRTELKPYGLTCELWTPSLMKKPDRHNEIELNYFTEGSVTYLFQDKKITVPSKRLIIFWGLIPHQIIKYERKFPYFVSTIPFSQFMEWKLPALFVDRILKGEILFESSEELSIHDEFLFHNWIKDVKNKDSTKIIQLEMRARLSRMANNNLYAEEKSSTPIHLNEINQVERISVYIARNYANPIKTSDIGNAVGLHSDYANSIFKKAFGVTLSEYITEERISHAQRKLAASDMSITEIAFDCGFNSVTRFNAAFKKINNCTPREFRKRNSRN